jgi:hypothetical protein
MEYGVMGEDFQAVYGGCPTVVSYSDLARHQNSCQFAPGKCAKGCGYFGPLRYHNCGVEAGIEGAGAQNASDCPKIAKLEAEIKKLNKLLARAGPTVMSPTLRPDYDYQRENVVELAQFFAFHLESGRVENLDTNRFFLCVQSICADFKKGYRDNPTYFSLDLRMLLSIVLAMPGWSKAQVSKYREFLRMVEISMK